MILISVQETATSRSRAVGLISAFKMVFPSFLVRILISLAMLLMNRKNLLVEEVAFFENALDFWKLMVRIGKILCAKVVCRIAIVGNYSTLCFFFFFFLGRFPRFRLTYLPMSDLGELGIYRRISTCTFQWHKSCTILSFGCETASFGMRVVGVISLLVVRFPVLILGNSRVLLTSRDNQLLGKLIIFETLLAFWKLIKWIEKTLCTKAALKWVSFCPKHLVKFY